MTGMRSIIALLITVIAATFAAGYLSLSYRLQPKNTPDYSEIIRTRKAFTESQPAVSYIDLNQVFTPSTKEFLFRPAAHLPKSAQYPYEEISKLYRYSKTCEGNPPTSHNGDLKKAWEWHKFRCGKSSALSKDFFERKPWIHPSGSSYAFMAFQSGLDPFVTSDWLSAHLHRMHIMELSQLPQALLSESQKLLSTLDRSAMTALSSGAPIALSSEWVLVEKGSSNFRDSASENIYGVYPRSAFRDFLKSSPVLLEDYQPNHSCLLREGNGCWDYNLDKLYRKASLPTLLLIGATLLLAVIVAWILILTIRKQRLQAERTRFALRTITHELRTPVTDLVLSSDVLRSDFDRLSVSAQDAFMRLLNDIQRLLRLTEQSKQYLRTSDQTLIATNPVTIPSIKEFLTETAMQMNDDVLIDEQSEDLTIEQDPYWLSLCVRNLLSNALRHGKPPVKLGIKIRGSQLIISVVDQGECEFDNLRAASTPFQKGAKSQGLGLGLSIVQEAIRSMQGSLEMTKNPTTLNLILPIRAGSEKS